MGTPYNRDTSTTPPQCCIMREALWCFPVHNVFPYMKYLHSFVSRPRLVKASGDWIAYSAVVRNNSVVVRKNSAKFVVLISLNEATRITSRVLHLACGQETSARRNFFEIDFAREFSFVKNYFKPLRFVCLLSLCWDRKSVV